MGLCFSKSSHPPPAAHAPRPRVEAARPASPAAGSTDGSIGSDSSLDSPLAPRSPALSDIPPRPRAKIDALAQATQRAQQAGVDPALIAYAAEALEQIEWRQPDEKLAGLDRQHLPALTAECNRRHPGLNAVAFDTPGAFLDQLRRTDNPPAWRGLLQIGPPSMHRIAVDVRQHEDGSISLLLLEAAQAYDRTFVPHAFLRGYESLAKTLRREFGEQCRLAVIESGAQKSLGDCSIYAVSYAMELQRHQADFDPLHERLRTEGRCLQEGDAASETARGIELVDGRAILPPAFYKHAQSRATVAHVASVQGPAANLAAIGQRLLDFRVHREDPEVQDGSLDYGMSVETSRLTKLRHVIEAATRAREAEAAGRPEPASVSAST